MNSLFAGAAKTDITPPLGTLINGDFISHYARYIHDNLYARALVLKQGEITIAIVVVDICVMPKEFIDNVKAQIYKYTAIEPDHILISSTHTHAAGSIASVYLSAPDLIYTNKLPDYIVSAVKKAKQNLISARIGFGQVDVPSHVRCRRYYMKEGFSCKNPVSGGNDKVKTNPFGFGEFIDREESPTDPQVSFLAVQGTDDQWISVLANYSLHYVGDWKEGSISPDYFGAFARQIKHKLHAGDNFIGIMSNGTSGDVNIWEFAPSTIYPSEELKKSELIGTDIAQNIFQIINTIEWEEDSELSVLYSELKIGVRKPGIEELESAKKTIAETNYGKVNLDDDGLRRIYAREQVLLNQYEDEILFPVQVIKIGKGIIGGLGGEIFAETGMWLKKNAPLKYYFTIGLANGNYGYIPPEHEFQLGGYETWRCRSSYLELYAEELIKKKQLGLIKSIYNQ